MLSTLLGGCFLAPWSPERPPSDLVSGPAVYAEGCERCHEARVGKRYAESLHAALGIRCEQCHAGGNHPDFAPTRDATCAGCHQPQFQQTVTSKHFASRVQHPLDGDRPARVALRRGGFTTGGTDARKFVGDAA